ncbi:MAG: protein kinase [Chthoniobacterales bacterium]
MSEATPQIIEPCPSCGQLIDVTDEMPFSEVACPGCGAEMRARKQFNNFSLLELLGEGGMGSVFKANDLNLQRAVALKILKKEAGATESDWQKLEQEARITASINHPHVVKVFSFGEDHGQFYLAMELVEKGSLDELMTLQGAVSEAQVLGVGIQIAEGLQAALERGLLHRDVKPGNILFADANTAKIVDFGLALLLAEEAQERGEIWGTPYYIAPEKLDNRPEDFRSDLYSLGGTLFHALAGRPPFEASTASMVALKHIKSQAVSLQAFAPDVSSETAYVINRMLQKDPDDRYASYEELIGHLSYARDTLLERSRKPAQRKQRVEVESKGGRTLMGLIWMTTLVVVIAGAASLYLFRDSIFTDEEAASARGGASEVKIYNESVAEGREEFLAGRYADARESYAYAAAQARDLQPSYNWATALEGLSALMAGDEDEANQLFEAMHRRGLFSLKGTDQGLANFFVELGRLMAAPRAVGPGSAAQYSKKNFESFGLFAFGLKNWEMGKVLDAAPWLKAFELSNPEAPNQWIAAFKPVVAPYLADYALYEKLQSEGAGISGPAVAGFATRVESAKRKTTTGSRIKDLMDSLVEEARAR